MTRKNRIPSDIEIAQNSTLRPITAVAETLGLNSDDLDLYGAYKAKLTSRAVIRAGRQKKGKLILVTAMTPTPAGEGKTTVSIGLAQALSLLGHKTSLALREPSLGPVFGVKGGAAGGGYSQVLPMEDLNLHFTGDLHAITAANNLLAAMIDNHLFQNNALSIDKDRVLWKRCMDINDRALRNIIVGCGGEQNSVERSDAFSITAASEIMSVVCMAQDLDDLKRRLARIVIAYDLDGHLLTAGQLDAQGAMCALLADALRPNLIQSIEHTPAFIHGGPFANISHGCNSIIATKTALGLSDIVVTEAGFGADLGAEKFLNIKCREAGLWPDAIVLVGTIRSLKYNAGIPKDQLDIENIDAVMKGFANLAKHIENMRQFGLPCIVASNRFPSDTQAELDALADLCAKNKAAFAPADIYAQGGQGGLTLARQLLDQIDGVPAPTPQYTYDLHDSIKEKINKVARQIYGARDVAISDEAQKKIASFEALGFGTTYICMAKTQYSLSDNPKSFGRPEPFTLTVRDVYLSAGAGYLVVLTGKIMTMPGLPPRPAAVDIGVTPNGQIYGLF